MKKESAPLVILVAIILFGSCTNSTVNTADSIVVNGIIWTGNANQPIAESFAIVADTIAAIGTNDEIAKWKGERTQTIDAQGQFITPGFIDSHVHFLTGGFRLSSVQLRDAKSQKEFALRIKDFTEKQKPGTWIQGGDWDHENWGGELPTREWIDADTPDHPVFIIRLDGHMGLANTAALKLAGLDKNVKNVDGGMIGRLPNGELSGIFRDNAMDLVARVIPAPSEELQDVALAAAMNYVASNGVTTIHNMGDPGGTSDIELFQRARDKGALITRAYVSANLSNWEWLAKKIETEGRGDKWVKIGVLKGFVDGSLGSHTAAFFKPFDDIKTESGLFVNTETDLYQWASGADKAGLHLAIHAIGDRAINTLINIYERVAKENGPRDRRFRIEHVQHLDAKDIPRFSELGIIASMQPYHAIDDGRWAIKIIGPERIKTTYAFKSLLDANATLAFGSDWFVAPPTPLEGIYGAVTRRTLDEANPDGWVPEEKISAEEALKAYTITAAYASFDESIKGSLEVGKLADFVIMDQNLLEIDPIQIRRVKIVRTVVGGKTVYVVK